MTPLRAAQTPAAEPHPGTAGRPDLPFGQWRAELEHADPDRRRRAALAAVSPSDEAAAIDALVGRVGLEPDPAVRQAVCTRLAGHDLPAVVDGLIPLLASDDVGLRTAVVDVLSRTPKATGERVPQLLAHPDPDVRILTVMVLASLHHDGVRAWLTQVVREDPHPNVVSAAVGELAAQGDPGTAADLTTARDRFPDDPFIAFAVGRALTGLGGRPA